MTPLDKAIIAYRENPTEENKRKLEALSAQHVRNFNLDNAAEFIRRTS